MKKAVLLLTPLTLAGTMALAAQQMMAPKPQAPSPFRGYMAAHDKVQNPLGLLGGPVDVTIDQSSGGVFVALPDNRKLDPVVFGTPAMPLVFSGTPIISGLPTMMRNEANGAFTTAKPMSPFGDANMVMADGKLMLKLHDETATDAATSKDKVELMASWKDKDGNSYEVRCCKMLATHGVDYPTFGGVVTNTILHGSSGIGTPLMPTEYVYAAFWGMGQVLKNGEVIAQPRLIHGMLTEYVRGPGYTLDFDKDVSPTRTQFHLIVPPAMPNMKEGGFTMKPLDTGFKLPNGKTLPFWHVMFENLKVSSNRGGM